MTLARVLADQLTTPDEGHATLEGVQVEVDAYLRDEGLL